MKAPPLLHISSIQKRLGLVFLAFLILLVVSAALTFIGLDSEKQDARVINLAGRQRMLLEQISGLALATETGEDNSNLPALLDAASSFEQTLIAFRNGGAILDYTGERVQLPPPPTTALKSELDALNRSWLEYRAVLDRLAGPGDPAAIPELVKQIEDRTPALTEQADQIVRGYEAVSTARINRLRVYQIIFLCAGLVLLSTGWAVTSRSVVQPLERLEKSAQRIGEGDLASAVQAGGPTEVRVLGQSMDTMRLQLQASHADLHQWAETLENRVLQRTRELEALAAVSREINSHLSIEEVLSSVTEKARTLLGAEVASLCLLDEEGKVLTLHSAAAPEAAILSNQSPANEPMVGKVLEQHCAHPCGLESRQGFCRILSPAYRTSHLAAALYQRENVIGALCVGSSAGEAFRPEMVAVLTLFADAAAVALENSRLYQRAEYAATLEERQRMAAEMHDGLLQTVSFLRLMVSMMRDQLEAGNAGKVVATLGQIERAEAQAEREIRQAIESAQDDYPLNDTLQERLRVLLDEIGQNFPGIHLETQAMIPIVFSRQESEQVLRIAREAILNAQRYSKASRIGVCLEKNGPELILSVQDDGIGFAPDGNPDDGRPHFGMKIMQARAARLGGTLRVTSSPGQGTLVELHWSPGTNPSLN